MDLYYPRVVVLGVELRCPHCGFLHIDDETWGKKLHNTHLCVWCNKEFKVYTVGSFKK